MEISENEKYSNNNNKKKHLSLDEFNTRMEMNYKIRSN